MNQYLTGVAIIFGLILLGLVIPGIKFISEAILKFFLEGLFALFRHKWTFVVWFFKTLSSSHMRVLRHATVSRDEIDPTQKVRRKAMGYDD